MMVVKKAVRHPLVDARPRRALMVVIVVAFGKYNNGVELFPNVEPEYGLVYVHARGNLSLDEQDNAVRRPSKIAC
jgi:multidrug efflux pump